MPKENRNNADDTIEVGVIGGGIAGCTTALALSDKGIKVLIFESMGQLLEKTSNASSNCFSTGFYYTDIAAAVISLETCINLIRELKEKTGFSFQVRTYSEDQPPLPQVNRVFYGVSTESTIEINKIINLFESLKSHYAKLVQHDSRNAVLGDVDSFYKILDKRLFIGILNTDMLTLVIDTCDTLFDWPLLKNYLIYRINSHSNITIFLNTEIKAIQMEFEIKNDKLKKVITSKTGRKYLFDSIVNASWDKSDWLNQTAGYFSNKETTNNIQCIAIIKLPKELHYKSFFIGYENFCFLTSGHDGIGHLTYQPVSNIAEFSSHFPNNKEANHTQLMSIDNQNILLGNAIIKGASQYICALQKSTLIDLKIGIIRNDKHEKKQFKGVYPVTLGHIVNEARQHTFWLDNSQKTLQLIEAQSDLKQMIMTMVKSLINDLPHNLDKPRMFSVLLLHFSSLFIEPEQLNKLKESNNKELTLYSSFFYKKAKLNNEIEQIYFEESHKQNIPNL